MIDFIKDKRNYIIALAIFFVFVSLSDTTYSLFIQSENTDEFTYNTGLLDLQFVEEEPLVLQNAFPMNDSEAESLEPYRLTLKNTGNLIYYFSLKMVSSEGTNAIDSRYIKVKVNNDLAHTLSYMDNVIVTNQVIYPGEEKTFDINIWLDINTPNNELGKKFTAKITTVGNSIYKTLDDSGANSPILYDNMLPVYYDEGGKTWKIADRTNLDENNVWFNYDKAMWANVVNLKSSSKKIYDLKRNNDLTVSNIEYNNGNIILDENYFDINIVNYQEDEITNIFRLKVNNIKDERIYFMSNGNLLYYYDNLSKKFVFKNSSGIVSSSEYMLEKDKWYIIGYSYDLKKVNFYVDGVKIGSANLSGDIDSDMSFKIGTNENFKDVSKLTVGTMLIYNRILSDSEISKRYKNSMQIIEDGLYVGYDEFIPMTLEEYYLSRGNGFSIKSSDIASFYVWIPRFKYRLWNVTGDKDYNSYNALKQGIEIVFENGDTSSGAVYCQGTNCFSNYDKTIAVTKLDNDKYYTHPAFSNTGEDLSGFWVSKYEISLGKNYSIESTKGNEIWMNGSLSKYYENIKKISNDYDYHVIKNTEWGAITYLANSKYGVCKDNKCATIANNNSFISGGNSNDSTTGNIYGVFDMAGGAREYTMGNITTNDALNLNNSYFKNVPIGTDDYDLYKKDMFILGDATKEVSVKEINYDNNWIIRGNSSIFDYSTSNDLENADISTRIVSKK